MLAPTTTRRFVPIIGNKGHDGTGFGITYGGSGAIFAKSILTPSTPACFITELQEAFAGSQIITKSRGLLNRPFVVPAEGDYGHLYVRDLPNTAQGTAIFDVLVADHLRLRYVLQVNSGLGAGVGGTYGWSAIPTATMWGRASRDGEQRWTVRVTKADSWIIGEEVDKDDLVLDYGRPGDGIIEIIALEAVGGPSVEVRTWQFKTNPSSGLAYPGIFTTQAQMGQLNGLPALGGSVPAGYGFYGINAYLAGVGHFADGSVQIDEEGINIQGDFNASNWTNAPEWQALTWWGSPASRTNRVFSIRPFLPESRQVMELRAQAGSSNSSGLWLTSTPGNGQVQASLRLETGFSQPRVANCLPMLSKSVRSPCPMFPSPRMPIPSCLMRHSSAS